MRRPNNRSPVQVPRHLADPRVEDYVSPDEPEVTSLAAADELASGCPSRPRVLGLAGDRSAVVSAGPA